jgi:EmrB/QacA subfamily drug resistance transporter
VVDTSPASSGAPAVEHPWRALTVTLLVGFMSLLDVTIVNVAVPSIEQGLDASPETVQWVVSGYALTFGLTLVAGGRLGDVVGRRRMFLIGLVGFTLTSALAGAAWDGPSIVVARLLQGACAGLLTPQNTGLIQELFTGADRGRAFGLFGTTVGVSAASGPLVGGLLIEAFGPEDGWRWVFLVNVPIGLVGMAMAVRLLPRQPAQGGRSVARQIDVTGALLLGLATLTLLFPVVEAQASHEPRWWLLLLVTPVATWLFLRRERRVLGRGGAPLLDVRLFSEVPGFASGIALGSVYFCGFAGIWLVLALFFQGELGYSALESGLAVMPFAVGSAATSVVAGRLVARHGRRVTVTGLALVVVGFASLAVVLPLVSPHDVALWAALPLLVAGIGSGATISPNFTLTLAEVPPRMGGAAGGAVQTGQRIGTAVGAAVLAAAYRVTLERSGPEAATAVTFTTSAVFAVVALLIAVRELRLHPFGSRLADAPAGPA